jgi:hypothetical protein
MMAGEISFFWKGKIEEFDLLPDLSALQLGRDGTLRSSSTNVQEYFAYSDV